MVGKKKQKQKKSAEKTKIKKIVGCLLVLVTGYGGVALRS